MTLTFPSSGGTDSMVTKPNEACRIQGGKTEIDSTVCLSFIKKEPTEVRIKLELGSCPISTVFRPKKEEESNAAVPVQEATPMITSTDMDPVPVAAVLEGDCDKRLHPSDPVRVESASLSHHASPNPTSLRVVSESQPAVHIQPPSLPRRTKTRFFLEAVEIIQRPPFSGLENRYSLGRGSSASFAGQNYPGTNVGRTSAAALDQQMDMLQNPRACNLKVRRSNEFSRDTVYQRLKPLGLDFFPISLPKHEQDHAFSRLFISSIYGGSVKGSRPVIGASFFDKTGLKDFLYLNLEHHLHAPQVPGGPGLYLSLTMSGKGPGIDISGVWIVFTRLASDEWGYMGLYELKLSQPLRKEEWLVQSEKVRHGWAKRILDNSWGISCRARIACRKAFGREPTNEEAGAGASGEYGSITHEDVVNALINGEETLNVWTMKCVGYDVGLQRNLIENVKTWVRPPPRFAGGKAATSVRGNRKGKKPQPMNGQ